MPFQKSHLYFMLNPSLGIIKIGIAGDIEARRVSLEHGCGVPLEVLAMVSEGERFEKDLHDAFDANRLRGEWFAPTEELLALIARPESIGDFLHEVQPRIAAVLEEREHQASAKRAALAGERETARLERARIKTEQDRLRQTEKARARRRRREEQDRQRLISDQRRAEFVATQLLRGRDAALAPGRRELIAKCQAAASAATPAIATPEPL